MMSIGTLPDTLTHNERRYAFFASRELGIAGQVTLNSRRDQVKDRYDTDRYQVRFSDAEHVVFAKLLAVSKGDGSPQTRKRLERLTIPYSVWLRDGTRPAGCTCMAGQNRTSCKHIDIAKALLANDGPPAFGYVPQTDTTLAELPF